MPSLASTGSVTPAMSFKAQQGDIANFNNSRIINTKIITQFAFETWCVRLRILKQCVIMLYEQESLANANVKRATAVHV